ncbi:MAG TPA: RNA-binding cell elongation regulator Jag/EloR [Acidimicrobiales bacterium]|nr:RNA-binding cell elongation regulator Jag/EloR [Acidimicrobiales bacterium]
MEWVETTGRTVEEAKEAALDQLGVDEGDAEFEIVEEAKSGLFGRLRQEARVRARVEPARPRPKAERRDRKRRAGEGEDERAGAKARASDASGREAGKLVTAPAAAAPRPAEEPVMAPEEREERLQSFLSGLVDAFGLEGRTEVHHVDEEILEGRVTGDGLGLLIGPRGQTLAAVQELARSAVLRGGGRGIRLRVDVGGYQERRREALQRFTREIAEQVLSTGTAVSMEPMPPPDRKVVHDTVNTIDGVTTHSEGEEPKRRVLIVPEDAAT